MVKMADSMATTCGRKVLVCIFLSIVRFFNLISRLFIPHLRKRGILTFYWIVNDEEGWERAIGMGCKGIMTDMPTELRKYLLGRGLYFEEREGLIQVNNFDKAEKLGERPLS